MLDHGAYYHIVETIADAAAGQYYSALALRPVCARFRSKADASLGRHVRLERLPTPSPAESSGESSGVEEPTDVSTLSTTSDTLGVVSLDPGPLVVLTSTGSPLPLLYPSASPPLNRAWPALKPALASLRILDFCTSPTHPERGLVHALKGMELDTLRFVGVNDADFSLSALKCRRLVGMSAVALPVTHSDWENFYPRGTLPRVGEKVVLNVVLPRRSEAGGIRMPAWHASEPLGEWDMVFLFRAIDLIIPYPPCASRPGPDLGALFNLAITVLDIATTRKYTLVGLEEVEWTRLGVHDPGKTKEKYFREALEGIIVPVLGLEKGMINIDEIQSRITFVSYAEYEKSVGRAEYEGDFIPLEGLFEQFASAGA